MTTFAYTHEIFARAGMCIFGMSKKNVRLPIYTKAFLNGDMWSRVARVGVGGPSTMTAATEIHCRTCAKLLRLPFRRPWRARRIRVNGEPVRRSHTTQGPRNVPGKPVRLRRPAALLLP